ncbi:MAG: SH3 domain-containing protein [Clostridiales Family XIII bacterium]|jgi:hypothetical protein|nr:SH3 domain-containing protein [Clostridiales Family XIII bacterium]
MAKKNEDVTTGAAAPEDVIAVMPPQRYLVTAARLNVREEPDKKAGVLRIIKKGDTVIGEEKGGYIAIEGGGYIAAEFVGPAE